MDCGRDQAFLLPPDLREWIPEDDLAHFVIEVVERVDMSAFKVCRGTGSAQYHPRMMLALLIYCKRWPDPISGSGLTSGILEGRLERRRQPGSVAGSKFQGSSSWIRDCGCPAAIFSSVLLSQA